MFNIIIFHDYVTMQVTMTSYYRVKPDLRCYCYRYERTGLQGGPFIVQHLHDIRKYASNLHRPYLYTFLFTPVHMFYSRWQCRERVPFPKQFLALEHCIVSYNHVISESTIIKMSSSGWMQTFQFSIFIGNI